MELTTLVTTEPDGTLRFWQRPELRETVKVAGHAGSVQALAVSADGRFLASSSRDSSVRLWSIQTGEPLAEFRGHRGSVDHVYITPDGKSLVTGQEADFRISGPTGGGLGVSKLKADAVIALWDLDPPAFRRFLVK
jgi:WD40 repeat protein